MRIDAPSAMPVCIPCAFAELDLDQPLTITPEVRREVLAVLRRRLD